MFIELAPAYGRDYNSKEACLSAYNAGRDFLIVDQQNRWYGKPINKQQVEEAGYTPVKIRYSGMRKSLIVQDAEIV